MKRTFRFYNEEAARCYRNEQLRKKRTCTTQLQGRNVIIGTHLMQAAINDATAYSGYLIEDFEELD